MFLSETLILQIEGVTVHLQSGRYSNDMSSIIYIVINNRDRASL